MRILATTDIHGSKNALDFIETFSSRHEPDILCIAGDLSHFGPAEWSKDLLDKLPLDCLAIPGNCDPPETADLIEETTAIGLHLKKEEINGISFVGLGGSCPTPFPTLFEWEDSYAYKIEELLDQESVLLCHNPPHGYVDKTFFGSHVGSKALREIVDRKRPRLMISGHIHEARGTDENASTRFVNPGMLAKGYAAVIDIDENIEIRLISIK